MKKSLLNLINRVNKDKGETDMPNISGFESVPRRALHIFYVLDTSGSMSGTPIATLNRAMEETVVALKDVANKNADAQLKIAVMEFNTKARWVTANGPEDMEDFIWEDLKAMGLTSMGDALKELDEKMSRSGFLESMTGAYMPIIILMTDGQATDDYKKALEKIRGNKWFKRGTKIAFALGDYADRVMMEEIVGNPEAVIETNDLEAFASMLKLASVTSSMLQSISRTVDLDGKDVIEQLKGDSLPGESGIIGTPEPPFPIDDPPIDIGGGWPEDWN